MGVKLYMVNVKAPTELRKAFRSNSGADAAAERKNAKDAENVYKTDEEVDAEEQEDEDEKEEAYGKSMQDIAELEKGKKVPVGTVSGKYKKVAEGKWARVKSEKGRKDAEHDADYYYNQGEEENTEVLKYKEYVDEIEKQLEVSKEHGVSKDEALDNLERRLNKFSAGFQRAARRYIKAYRRGKHIQKAMEDEELYGKALELNFEGLLKAKEMPVGSVSTSGKYKKVAKGKWEKVKKE